jgi:hypothetical protein
MALLPPTNSLGAAPPQANGGRCDKCATINSYSSLVCDCCGSRLPWAAVQAPSSAQSHQTTHLRAAKAEWYYSSAGNRVGPVSLFEIKDLIKSGDIKRDTTVWRQGMQDWQAAGISDLSKLFEKTNEPPPLLGDDVNNTIVWVLAFAPVFYAFASLGWLFAIIINLCLCAWDEHNLKKAGHDTKGMTVWAVLLVPVYLFTRASRLKHKGYYAWVWLIMFIISLGAPQNGSIFGPTTEDVQQTVFTGINDQLREAGRTETCIEVTLAEESANKYTAFVKFSDGTSLTYDVTADDNGTVIWRPKIFG